MSKPRKRSKKKNPAGGAAAPAAFVTSMSFLIPAFAGAAAATLGISVGVTAAIMAGGVLADRWNRQCKIGGILVGSDNRTNLILNATTGGGSGWGVCTGCS